MEEQRLTRLQKTNYEVIYTYREILRTLYDVGTGNKTEFGTKVSQYMIEIIEGRLNTLKRRHNLTLLRSKDESRIKSNGTV